MMGWWRQPCVTWVVRLWISNNVRSKLCLNIDLISPEGTQKGGQMGMMQQIQNLQEQLTQAQEQAGAGNRELFRPEAARSK